jgi:hypothetical protein
MSFNEGDISLLNRTGQQLLKQFLPHLARLRAQYDAACFAIKSLNKSSIARSRGCLSEVWIVRKEQIRQRRAPTATELYRMETGRLVGSKNAIIVVEQGERHRV